MTIVPEHHGFRPAAPDSTRGYNPPPLRGEEVLRRKCHGPCAVQRRCSPAGESPAREVGLFHPVAVGIDEEVTNRLKLSMSTGRSRRLSKQAGRNLSERRAGLETKLADADPAVQGGRPSPWSSKPPRLGANKAEQPGFHGSAGVVARACLQGEQTQHGRPIPVVGSTRRDLRREIGEANLLDRQPPTERPRGTGQAGVGVGQAHSTEEAG